METKTVRISTTIDHITPAVPEDAMMGQNTLLRCQREPLKDVQQHWCSTATRGSCSRFRATTLFRGQGVRRQRLCTARLEHLVRKVAKTSLPTAPLQRLAQLPRARAGPGTYGLSDIGHSQSRPDSWSQFVRKQT